MKILTFIIRLIAMPFLAGLMLVKLNSMLIIDCFRFIFYGGEYIGYCKDSKATIADIYEKLKD